MSCEFCGIRGGGCCVCAALGVPDPPPEVVKRAVTNDQLIAELRRRRAVRHPTPAPREPSDLGTAALLCAACALGAALGATAVLGLGLLWR